MNERRRAYVYLLISMLLFLFSLGAVDYWVHPLTRGEGPESGFNYWISLGFAFLSFGLCLSTVVWMANPKTHPTFLLGVFVTPFLLLVAGVWDWIIYFIFLRYDTPYPDYNTWSAQSRWFGDWNMELQLLWTCIWIVLIIVMWLKITKTKVDIFT